MAITTTNYSWNGLTISPYAKITERDITDFVAEDGSKKYNVGYSVNVYTTGEKDGDVAQFSYSFVGTETSSLADAYADLKTRDGFTGWTDVIHTVTPA